MTFNEYLDSIFKKIGIGENNLTNNMKKRNIRIQLCLKGIDLETMGSAILNSELQIRIDSVLKSLNLI